MTETSYLWTTNAAGTGDQVASYTQAQLAEVWRITAACNGFEGVAPGYDDELACSDGGANTVDVATGGAMVDGKPYSNSAVENVNIPSAVGAGNTRIDRLVLRATWASFTVRITRIAGTDAASPVAPAITQTSGTTYDIQLCRVLVDVSGNVTVTDERVWAAPHVDDSTLEVDQTEGYLKVKALGIDTAQLAALAVETAKIADANVTLAKMAANSVDSDQYVDGSIDTAHIGDLQVTTGKLANDAVDDTKVGNRVPQFYRRQGGDATDWSFPGTTTYTPGAVRMQAGAKLSDAYGLVFVTFPVAFSAVPLVFLNVEGYPPDFLARSATLRGVEPSETGLSAEILDTDGYSAVGILYWLAIGPE